MQQQDRPLIGIVGGTGDVGRGLARRWARAGYSVIIGSRLAARGQCRSRGPRAESGGINRGLGSPRSQSWGWG